MAATTTTSKPSPERIFNTMIAFQETEALKAAIELDIFTAIAEGANTAAALAAKTGTSERGMRILCDYFTVKEFLTKKGEKYEIGRSTRLNSSHMSTLFPYTTLFRSRTHFQHHDRVSGDGSSESSD